MELSAAVAALAALAQESRLEIYRLLVQAGPKGMPAGHIADALDLPGATLSFHLNHLRQAGLVGFERQGRSLLYAARYPVMRALMSYLTENCCRGASDDCATAGCQPTGATAINPGANRHEARTRARRR